MAVFVALQVGSPIVKAEEGGQGQSFDHAQAKQPSPVKVKLSKPSGSKQKAARSTGGKKSTAAKKKEKTKKVESDPKGETGEGPTKRPAKRPIARTDAPATAQAPKSKRAKTVGGAAAKAVGAATTRSSRSLPGLPFAVGIGVWGGGLHLGHTTREGPELVLAAGGSVIESATEESLPRMGEVKSQPEKLEAVRTLSTYKCKERAGPENLGCFNLAGQPPLSVRLQNVFSQGLAPCSGGRKKLCMGVTKALSPHASGQKR